MESWITNEEILEAAKLQYPSKGLNENQLNRNASKRRNFLRGANWVIDRLKKDASTIRWELTESDNCE